MDVPHCEYRVQTKTNGVFFCRHSAVATTNNQVTFSVCRICPVRTVPCENRRPVPTEEELVKAESASLGRMAAGFTRSMVDFAKDGFRLVSDEQYEERLAICHACDFYVRKANRCRKCGCGLRYKPRGRAFRCPVDKWPEIDTSEE